MRGELDAYGAGLYPIDALQVGLKVPPKNKLHSRYRCLLHGVSVVSCEFNEEYCKPKKFDFGAVFDPSKYHKVGDEKFPARAIFDTGMGITCIGHKLAKKMGYDIGVVPQEHRWSMNTITQKSFPYPAIATFKLDCGSWGERYFTCCVSVADTKTYANDVIFGLGDIVPYFDFSFENAKDKREIDFWLTAAGIENSVTVPDDKQA